MASFARCFIATVLMVLLITPELFCQNDQASLLLDLKKTRAAYRIASQRTENDKVLFENKAISQDEFNRSKNELMGAEVEYQKQILRVMAQQSYILVEKAVKYQNRVGQRRVKVTLSSTVEGNQEYLNQFQEHFDVFTAEMRSGHVYNVFVSLSSLDDQTTIGMPYEIRVPRLTLGESTTVDFGLLRDVESLQISMNYSGKTDVKRIQLVQDAASSMVDINSTQFSQEVNLGAPATYDLSLERFSAHDDVYKLLVVNLPRQVNYDFIDAESGARLSQLKFTQGVNVKRLSLRAYLPERDDETVVIDQPIIFYALVLSLDQYNAHKDIEGKQLSPAEIDAIPGGKVKLELLPRGVGRIEVRALSLYHEISVGDSVAMEVTVRNDGTRRLDNIRISTDNPLNWRSAVRPDLIRFLEPEQESIVQLIFYPPDDVGVGAQEVKIKTEAMADNRSVETEDKTVRIQVKARAEFLWTAILIFALVGLVIGIVVFGIKISRR
jgi:NPCBM-associated, NEW3 domain of alpha-galactosidase